MYRLLPQTDSRAYDLLALVVETISGVPFDQFVQTRILDPLKMSNTTFDIEVASQSGRLADGHWWEEPKEGQSGRNTRMPQGLCQGMGLRGAGGMLTSGNDLVREVIMLPHIC